MTRPVVTSADISSAATRRSRVLVASHDAELLGFAGQIIAREHDVTLIGHGPEALVAIRDEQPDLVLLDGIARGLPGGTLARQVRSDPQTANVPIVLLVPRGVAGVDELETEPIDDYLAKPFTERELSSRINVHLRLARALRARDAIERRLAVELAGARTLQSISTRLIPETTQETLYVQVLDAAMELMSSDFASIQMLADDRASLVLLGNRNFHPDSAAFWARVDVGSACACGRALREIRRIVIADVDQWQGPAGTADLDEYRRSGIRAVQSTPLQSRSGQPLGMMSTHWRHPHTPSEDSLRLFDVLARQAADLIERARADRRVQQSEQRFRVIANTAPMIMWMTDEHKKGTFVNRTWLEFTGRTADEADAGWASSVHPDDVERLSTAFSSAFDRRESFQVEYRLRRHDGEYRWFLVRGVPSYGDNDTFGGYVGSAVDITEGKRAEDVLSTLSQRLIEAQEEERARLARELHDDVNQRLSLLITRLGVVSQHSMQLEAERTRQIDEARAEVAALVSDVRAISYSLHPPQIEYLGLAAAAEALCEEASREQAATVAFRAEGVPASLAKRLSVCLYRVLQEALHNATKHSGGRNVDVAIRQIGDEIELNVADNGSGFDVAAARGRGLGLTSMEERLKAVGGQLFVESVPQRGTSIRARVPLIHE